ncbi:hypothetical protein K2173_000810 [Erythroxylum novogranatense]|uniref:SBP-type domain-containing protein n=1 Tax=Erythroxylum novogranatense TaxID=1862640 RepID=A0AAV8T430_9ROSI|nr:hypothetical protein K2173_000810 [Erythroxylum novogranatense]
MNLLFLTHHHDAHVIFENKNEVSLSLCGPHFTPIFLPFSLIGQVLVFFFFFFFFAFLSSFVIFMESNKAEGKRSLMEIEDEEEEEDDEDTTGSELGFSDNNDKKKKGKKGSSIGGSIPAVSCQADDCSANMVDAKRYHKRHKVCEHHAKAPVVLVNKIQQRFCQQCSRFHDLSEFDNSKKSCRRRLAGHNERRRKSSVDSHGEGFN